MSWVRRRSLARRIALAFLFSNALMLSAAVLLIGSFLYLDEDNLFGPDIAAQLAADSLVAGSNNGLRLQPSPALRALMQRSPELWIIARTPEGVTTLGQPSLAARRVVEQLPDALINGQLAVRGVALARGRIAVLDAETAVGLVRVIAGGVGGDAVGLGPWVAYLSSIGFLFFGVFLVVGGVGAVSLAVPFVLRAVRPLAAEAAAIGPDRLDRRLSLTGVVHELRPLAVGFNGALDRLAEAFERQRRFIADTAHELRTPVAVLNAQVDLLPAVPGKLDLQRGLARLGALIGQMLDAERLVLADRRREPTDLVALARRAAADMAPLALSSGYELAVEAEPDTCLAQIDPQAVSRALTNLIGNAVAHGGGAGLITVRVGQDGTIEVSDEGPGIPEAARERIFEPFRRERWDRDGCGLGLHLAREIMRAHGGDIHLAECRPGAIFRLELPTSALEEGRAQ